MTTNDLAAAIYAAYNQGIYLASWHLTSEPVKHRWRRAAEVAERMCRTDALVACTELVVAIQSTQLETAQAAKPVTPWTWKKARPEVPVTSNTQRKMTDEEFAEAVEPPTHEAWRERIANRMKGHETK